MEKKMGRILLLCFGVSLILSGCWCRKLDVPNEYCGGGYYNGYFNRNAIILYKRPSSKYRCWSAPDGWYCMHK